MSAASIARRAGSAIRGAAAAAPTAAACAGEHAAIGHVIGAAVLEAARRGAAARVAEPR